MGFALVFSGCGTFFYSKSNSVKIISPIPEEKKEYLPPIPIMPPPLPPPPPPPLPPENARFIPITWDIVNSIQSAGAKLENLRFYLSKPLSITIIEQNNAPRKFEVDDNGTLIVSREQNALPRRVDFSTSVFGTMRNNDNGASLFIIDFTVDGNDIPLRFVKNSQGLYDLFSAEVQTRPYSIRSDDGVPQLCIFAELNEHLEVRAIFDSAQNDNSRVANSQSDRGNIGPSVEKINAGNSQGQFSGRPSRRIDDTESRVNRTGIINYVKQNRSVNSATEATLRSLIDIYFDEAQIEGVNPDIAIAQMLYATNYLRNRMTTHNYAGFSINGARLNGVRWDGSFRDMREGVRAHIQHLKGYTSRALLNKPLVDPRYNILAEMGYLGQKNTFDQVFRVWSQNSNYGNAINRILDDLYRASGN
jgi:hypothetical protein